MVDRFAAMRSFRHVVDHAGFASAANALGVAKATVSKQVSALEAHLGTALLHRTTRKLSLTEAGQRFYADAIRILDELAAAEAQLAEDQAEPRGLLRVNAPLSFGVARLMPVVARFMAAHPAIRVDIALDDRTVDPVGRAFDVTLRIRTELDDSELTARRIGGIAHVVCVARDYAMPLPVRPEQLAEHRLLVYGANGVQTRNYNFVSAGGRDEVVDVRVTPALKSNSSLAIREALLAGAGIAVIPRFVVDGDLVAGRLMPLLREWRLPDHALFAIFSGERAPPAKVRRFIDMLADEHIALADADCAF